MLSTEYIQSVYLFEDRQFTRKAYCSLKHDKYLNVHEYVQFIYVFLKTYIHVAIAVPGRQTAANRRPNRIKML